MLSRRKRRVKSLVRANEPRCASCTVADGAVPADSSRGSDPVYLGRAVSIWGLNNAGGGITGIKRSVSFLLDFHLWCCFPYSLLRCRCWTDWASVKAVLALRVLQNDRCNEVFSWRLEKSARSSPAYGVSIAWKAVPPPFSFQVKGAWCWGTAASGFATLCHPSPVAPTGDPPRRWWQLCCGACMQRRGQTHTTHPLPPQATNAVFSAGTSSAFWGLTEMSQHLASAFIPSPEIKHMSGHRRLFSLLPTVPAVVWLCRTSQPLQRHFWCQGNSISWICFPLSLLEDFFWSLKPEIKGPASWSLLLQVQLHLLGFWYHSEQDFSSFHGLCLNFLHSLSFRGSQMSQLTLP